MQLSEAYRHIHHSERRQRVLKSLSQPLTAKQIARKTGLRFDSCRDAVRELAKLGLIHCINETARRSRLYWLTKPGQACQRRLASLSGDMALAHHVPVIDWALYGWVCYSHRSVILKTLTEPMQPADIKRKARSREAGLRMSANNVRDIIRVFRVRGIVRPVRIRKKAHLRYELTPAGLQFQELLRRAEVPTR